MSKIAHSIKERHEIISHLGEILHRWHCTADHGSDSPDGDNGCSWMSESWEPLREGTMKQVFFDKAAKVYEFYDDPQQCIQFLKFLQIINPRVCYTLIEEL